VGGFGESAPDAENIQNARGEYIVPGSSVKGSVRSQMEKIANYLSETGSADMDTVIRDTFGYTGDDGKTGKAGNIRFYDTVVGDREKNAMAHNATRIRIDKFTGGVMQTGLFSEKNVFGDLTLRVTIDNKNHPDRSLGLLVLALRDLAIGSMSLGSGYSVGKGIISVKTITIRDCQQKTEAVIDWKAGSVSDPSGMISGSLKALQNRRDEDADK
jgi:CRISPR/Cas system CSM-associated protein Csm3 (group 7 of RAMP superfamily)